MSLPACASATDTALTPAQLSASGTGDPAVDRVEAEPGVVAEWLTRAAAAADTCGASTTAVARVLPRDVGRGESPGGRAA